MSCDGVYAKASSSPENTPAQSPYAWPGSFATEPAYPGAKGTRSQDITVGHDPFCPK